LLATVLKKSTCLTKNEDETMQKYDAEKTV